VGRLAGTLKPEYAQALQRVEVDGVSVQAFAAEAGITANNAAVRLFRARKALKKQLEVSCGTCASHGCLDCTCGEKKAPGQTGGCGH
jgi:RNA polymerase sigma-70 factor (ECF subfamily)